MEVSVEKGFESLTIDADSLAIRAEKEVNVSLVTRSDA
jgi:hypothetical protein